jgi:hypothetical protein
MLANYIIKHYALFHHLFIMKCGINYDTQICFHAVRKIYMKNENVAINTAE